MSKKKVGVIGAGIMGTGVAQNLAQHDYRVVLIDLNDEILESARNNIKNNMRLQIFQAKDKSKVHDPDDIVGRIQFTSDYAALKNAFFIVENVPEKWDALSTQSIPHASPLPGLVP